jgi:hypothetical protein
MPSLPKIVETCRPRRSPRARDLRLYARAAATRTADPKPAECLHPVDESAQTRTALGVGVADPVVNDLDPDVPLPRATSTVADDAWACFRALVRLSVIR